MLEILALVGLLVVGIFLLKLVFGGVWLLLQIILFPIKSLIETMLASQTLNGVLLPIILVTMLKLINDKRLMGEYVNGRIMNFLSWATVVILIVLTVILVIASVFPGLLR